MILLRFTLTCALAIELSGCGVVYYPSGVTEQAGDVSVRVVPLTAETVLVANSQSYTPRDLPAAFFQTAGSGQPYDVADIPEPPAFPAVSPEALELRPPPAVDPGPYRLGTGDVLRLSVASGNAAEPQGGGGQGQTSFQDLTVRDDGAISIPKVGTVQVAGLTIDEAEGVVFSRLVDAALEPNLSLEVAGYNSQFVSIGGAVGTPKTFALALSPVSLAQAIAEAGGVTVTDLQLASIRIYRAGNLYQIPFSDFRKRGDLQKLRLISGDLVYVDTTYDLDRALAYYEGQINAITERRSERAAALAELEAEVDLRRNALEDQRSVFEARETYGANQRDYVYLAGEVFSQARVPLPFGQKASLADVLYGGGGFSPITGNPSQIYVLRASTVPSEFGAVTAWNLDARNAAALTLATRLEMHPNDIVFVQEQPVTSWNRVIDQITPNVITGTIGAVSTATQ